ncbi:helix-turn-helix domain-containing protein [Gordonia pseudamarae]|jgi:AraC-like DNA-binding protein|uniref:Helix-turn-helix domain-containing protein n=1 Tax=Gordonia pseudamarae TaxID=2831662 RepID=A0ABX6IKD8_9ACTN|nr:MULTISPECIES: AraC family transcriptional regulator [Gordonia]MBD0022569.1 helix-turn-helix transcriptional regulator [Gordonia sp. (in: high G+C Gram-positive bacteria)]QHN26864.1 helix-turn-helix domain-containing protein [Gordonia pseudamarae]QHN35755.1 helix-turn-helix domain-containing protein [Gordonia pseudamarae]
MSEAQRFSGDYFDFGASAVVYRGTFTPTAPHRHYAIQLIDCPQGIDLHRGEDALTGVTGVVIGSGVPHQLLSYGRATVTYVAPHTAAGRRIGEWIERHDDPRAGERPALGAARSVDVAADSVADEMVLWIGRRISDSPTTALQLSEVAAEFHRSAPSVRRMLATGLGVSYSQIVQWERLRLAIDLIAAGSGCTDAATGAGFYDGPHFSRVCKAMLGIAPRLIELRHVRPAPFAIRAWDDLPDPRIGRIDGRGH